LYNFEAMKLLEGKIALITGASKGIGRAIAQKFTEMGAQVAFTYLSSVEKGQQLEQELSASGVKVKGYRSDASDFAQAEKLIEAVVADFGRLDILVNNAVGCGADRQPEIGFQPHQSRYQTHDAPEKRFHHQHDFGSRY
jgi:NAD(P)-dependent dehydrogenase (short-subunit alcohol dehydrogenase family)